MRQSSDSPPILTVKQANIYVWGWQAIARFRDAVCGRRFGKTFLGKAEIRRAVRLAATCDVSIEDEIWYCAPTFKQGKRVFWRRLKQAIPASWRSGKPNETECSITTKSGHVVRIVGLDSYDNLRGSGLFFVLVDEWADCNYHAWEEVLRPMLSTCRYVLNGIQCVGGHALRIGTPKGFNHCYETYLDGQGREPDHRSWLYTSVQGGNVPPEEIEAARRKMDTLSFQQEYEASFVNFNGRAYYPFVRATHAKPLKYDQQRTLIFCFDFNVEPGIAAVCQEQVLPGQFEIDQYGQRIPSQPLVGTGVIGEVWIPRNSNTPAVCRKLLTDWGQHKGNVLVYGDATGGARGTAKVAGSDWDIIKNILRNGIDGIPGFGDRLYFKVPNANPPERSRVNAVNSRLQSAAGHIRLMVDPVKAPHVMRDLEGVTLLEGGSGEIDKRSKKKGNAELTHISDALGYYVVREFPISNNQGGTAAIGGQ